MTNNDELIKSLIIDATESQLNSLYTYFQILENEAKKYNLTTITEEDEVYIKHFYDSLLVSKVIKLDKQKIIDVGTGAGFPGLVLKIMYPNLQITLLEPTLKRCKFLSKVIETLKLKDVIIVNSRAEIFGKDNREMYDIACARAVASTPILMELLTPLVKINGKIIMLKGADVNKELQESSNAMHVLKIKLTENNEFDLPKSAGKRHILTFTKREKTNIVYPREYSKIKNQTL